MSLRLILVVFLVVADIYIFFILKFLTQNWSATSRNAVFVLHVLLSLTTFIMLFSFQHFADKTKVYVFTILLSVIVAKLIMCLIFLVDDIRRGLLWSGRKIATSSSDGVKISRSAFLSWLGMGLGTTFLGTMVYGMTDKYNYQIKNVKMKFANLPASFRGLRILQISDIHAGSFDNYEAVARGVKMVQDQKADMILFTGDLVNNISSEMDTYKDLFSTLKAPMGVYSTLGNHDYGDYVEWDSDADKVQNLESLKQLQKDMGWDLLMNENRIFERNGEKISLLGIENWGTGRFPKYGRLDLAYKGTENIPFKILMSHDPSHWDAQVNTEYKDIDLMLSGHTHGMQFGINTSRLKWSPIQYRYKEWAGKYKKENQMLYVNVGFGFLGYNGRVGILPEITVIELT